jgi:hypothetical protein
LTRGFWQNSVQPDMEEPDLPTLWNDLARTFLRAVPLLLAAGAAQIAACAVLPYALEGWVIWFLLLVVHYFLYRIALFDLRAPYLARYAPRAAAVPPEAPIHFLLALSLPFLLSAGAFLVLAVITFPESETGQDLLLFSSLGASWIALSVFGTLLPAAAARQPLSVDTALRVASGNWTRVALLLFLLGAVGDTAVLLTGFIGRRWLDGLSAAAPFHHAVDILLAAFGWASQVPTVVVLTRAYRQGWPKVGAAERFT